MPSITVTDSLYPIQRPPPVPCSCLLPKASIPSVFPSWLSYPMLSPSAGHLHTVLVFACYSSVSSSSTLGKAHNRSNPSLSRFFNVALDTVPMLVWFTTALSLPFSVDHRALPFLSPFFFQSVYALMFLVSLQMFS